MRSGPRSPLSSALEGPIRGEKLQVHIGVATGVVVVGEPIGFGDARQQTAIGETPNLAARLEEIAEPDSIVIDDVTRRQIGGLFTCRDLGELSLRGFRTPVRAWRVLGERAVGDRFAARYATRFVPLVGREEELALLLRRWQLAREGKGQLVLLTGELGIGKSRLVAELRARLRGEPVRQPALFLLAALSGESAVSGDRTLAVTRRPSTAATVRRTGCANLRPRCCRQDCRPRTSR